MCNTDKIIATLLTLTCSQGRTGNIPSSMNACKETEISMWKKNNKQNFAIVNKKTDASGKNIVFGKSDFESKSTCTRHECYYLNMWILYC